MFITFEGIDGSGKSTQIQKLHEYLIQKEIPVLLTRDPGGTALGQQLREILLHHPGFVADPCELFLYLADRAQHVAEIIRPALAAGKYVLSDRYTDSTVAYQGGGRGLSVMDIHRMNDIATGKLKPHKTFLLDGPAELLLGRAKNRSEADRLERETVTFYEGVRQQYLELAWDFPERFVILDATKPPDEIFQQLLSTFKSLSARN